MMVVINCFYSLSLSLFLPSFQLHQAFTRNVYSSPHGKILTEKKITCVEKPKMSSQNQRFHCLAENERFAILSLKFLVWGQNIFAFCPKSPIKIPNFSERQTLVFTSTRKKLKTWLLTKNSLNKTSSTEKSFFFKWLLNSKWNTLRFASLFHEHGRAEGERLPGRFMTETAMTPCDFNVWWQQRQSPLVLCMANRGLCAAQNSGGTALEKEPGAAVAVEAPELL